MNEEILDTPEEAPLYFHKPSLLPRIKSTLIDTLVIIVLMMIFSAVLNQINIESVTIRGAMLLLIVLYEPICTSINKTIGQKIMGLQVRQYKAMAEDGSAHNINIFASIIRYIIKILLGWISLLTIHSDDYGRAIHDKLANSVMTVGE